MKIDNPKTLIIVGIAAALVVGAAFAGGMYLSGKFSGSSSAPAAQAFKVDTTNSTFPAPRIAVIEGDRIMRDSKVGQDVQRQINELGKQAQADINQRKTALEKEQEQMKQQSAILSASAKAQKEKEFNAKVAEFEKYASNKEQLIQGGIYKAQQTVNSTMRGVMEALMTERGANMLMEKNAFMTVSNDMDITDEAIGRLDEMLPSLKVELTPLPPEVLEAARRQQQLQQQQLQQQR